MTRGGVDMRHPNAYMIIAKANDMSLVLFAKTGYGWRERLDDAIPSGSGKYYLCHPKHKEVCLAWLNGAGVQWKGVTLDTWVNIEPEDDPDWAKPSVFMRDDQETRIKPKKEKRWIAVAKNGGVTLHYPSKELVEKVLEYHSLSASYQIIEIEVEV